MNTQASSERQERDYLRLIIRPLLAAGLHARYPEADRSIPGDLVVNVVRFDDSVDPIIQELEAIRKRLDASAVFEEHSPPRPDRRR